MTASAKVRELSDLVELRFEKKKKKKKENTAPPLSLAFHSLDGLRLTRIGCT
jgi:hypothetical protein